METQGPSHLRSSGLPSGFSQRWRRNIHWEFIHWRTHSWMKKKDKQLVIKLSLTGFFFSFSSPRSSQGATGLGGLVIKKNSLVTVHAHFACCRVDTDLNYCKELVYLDNVPHYKIHWGTVLETVLGKACPFAGQWRLGSSLARRPSSNHLCSIAPSWVDQKEPQGLSLQTGFRAGCVRPQILIFFFFFFLFLLVFLLETGWPSCKWGWLSSLDLPTVTSQLLRLLVFLPPSCYLVDKFKE